MATAKRMWASRDVVGNVGGPRVQLWTAKPTLRKLGKKRGFCGKHWVGAIMGEHGLEIEQCVEIEPLKVEKKARPKRGNR